MREAGITVTCNRCGSFIFVRRIDRQYNDDGIAIDICENIPKGWTVKKDIDLCPECSKLSN